MSSPTTNAIGRVISFDGVDEPVRATPASVTSSELLAHHVDPSEVMVTTVPVRVAPVLVLRLAADLGGQPVTTVDVMHATESVVAGLGVWDGGSASLLRLVLGLGSRRPDDIDLQLLGVLVDKGSQQVATSCGRATLGHPAAAVAALASPQDGHLGAALAAGWLVAAGPMTPYLTVAPGEHVVAGFAHLGSVSLVTTADS
jgi:2-oxo-3-hexenedioate decarboxylase